METENYKVIAQGAAFALIDKSDNGRYVRVPGKGDGDDAIITRDTIASIMNVARSLEFKRERARCSQ